MQIKEMIREYWDYRSNSYSSDSMYNDTETREAWLGWLRSSPGREKSLKILDVGTGPGFLALLLAELGHEVTGVDLSGRMVEAARANAEKAGLRVMFLQGDAECLDFPDSSFDVVASKYLLWTLPAPEKAVMEWMRVAKAGGTVMAIDGEWYKSDPVSRLRTWLADIAGPKPEYRSRFEKEYGDIRGELPMYEQRPEKITGIFKSCGLSDVRVEPMKAVYDVQNRKRRLPERIAPPSPVYFITGKNPG